MGISFECGSCGKPFNVGVEFAGKTGRCKRCGATMQIPFESQTAPPADLYDLDEPSQPSAVPASASGSAASVRPPSSAGRPVHEPGVNGNIAALAAQIRAGQKGGQSQGRSVGSKIFIGAGLAAVSVPVLMILLALLLPAIQAARKAAERQRQLNQNRNENAAITPDQARQTMQSDLARWQAGPIALPRFPDLGSAEEVAPGVMLHQVVFGPTPMPLDDPPGQGGKLWVYLPSGDHADHSLPAILIAGAGSNLLNGMELGDGDRAEHLPYVKAGFAVVAMELDGMNHDETQSDQKMAEAMYRFQKARAGLVNAHIALEYALAKVPAIDPSRISVVGHSSAGSLAVLFAETEPRLKSAVAFAPALDYEQNFGAASIATITKAGFAALVTRYAPNRNIADLKCPLLLFHARDDTNTPCDRTEAFASQARADGKDVTLDLVDTGNHYKSMIQAGIPHAIAWLKGEPIPTGEAEATTAPADQPTPAPARAKSKARDRLEAAKKKAQEARRKRAGQAPAPTPTPEP